MTAENRQRNRQQNQLIVAGVVASLRGMQSTELNALRVKRRELRDALDSQDPHAGIVALTKDIERDVIQRARVQQTHTTFGARR